MGRTTFHVFAVVGVPHQRPALNAELIISAYLPINEQHCLLFSENLPALDIQTCDTPSLFYR
jgi:hypothetical protein